MLMTNHKILLVDDDHDVSEMLLSIFRRAGYTNLITAASGAEALRIWQREQPSMIVLDVMMPDMDGFSVLKEIRRTSRVPVLMLTARGEAEDRIEGLEIGADDYLAKPFLPKELLLRVGAILNRAYPKQNEMVELAGATVDMANAEVWKNGEKQTLTAKEMQLFEKLYQNAGRIVTTGILCETICGEFWQGYESTLSTHIRHLREKIEENPSKPVSLVTVKGLGYRLNLKGGGVMNTVQRFFRRYIVSTVGIVILFLTVNIALFFSILIAGSMSGSDAVFSVETFSNHIVWQDETWAADDTALSMLQEYTAWAMLLNEDGDVVWQQNLPENLPRSYTSAEVASFSRWYLEDYPVKVWTRADGNLMVVGFPPRTLVKFYYALEWPYMGVMLAGIAAVFIINMLLIIFLILRNTRKVEKAMTPILQGIQNLSHGKAEHLAEQGELAEINAGLNRAADYMRQKDNTRAEWIRGVSHDIRTPLSMVLGYASELEDDGNLPPDARKQAGIIRRESEKMKRLIDDLNLTTKLEYALQPVHFKDVDWVETSRQAVSEVLNSGLDSRYEIVFAEMQPGRSIHLLGDDGLLRRMLDNLIRNSITHNPHGCRISVSVGEENGRCLCTVSDDGIGIEPERLKVLNRGDDITSTQGSDEKNEHGLGLKLVMQIVKAHRGTVSFSGSTPHGLEVRISLPTQPLIS